MRLMAERARIVSEGAGALPLAAALTEKAGQRPIVAIVSGGNIDLSKFAELIGDAWLQSFFRDALPSFAPLCPESHAFSAAQPVDSVSLKVGTRIAPADRCTPRTLEHGWERQEDSAMRRVAWTLVAGATFLASGSLVSARAPIYIAGGQLPTVEPLRLEPADRPTGTLRLSNRLFREPIERTTRESGVFKAFAIEPGESRTPSTDYAVTIEVRARPRRPTVGHVAYTLTAAMTLGVLPLTRQVDLRLTVTLADRTGQVLKVYTFEDSIHEVQQVAIMFLPIGAVLTPDRAATRIVENMMRHL